MIKENLLKVVFPTIIAKTASAPFDRLKIIHQAQNTLQINDKSKYFNAIQYFSRIPKEQGITAFWRGNFVNCFSYIP